MLKNYVAFGNDSKLQKVKPIFYLVQHKASPLNVHYIRLHYGLGTV